MLEAAGTPFHFFPSPCGQEEGASAIYYHAGSGRVQWGDNLLAGLDPLERLIFAGSKPPGQIPPRGSSNWLPPWRNLGEHHTLCVLLLFSGGNSLHQACSWPNAPHWTTCSNKNAVGSGDTPRAQRAHSSACLRNTAGRLSSWLVRCFTGLVYIGYISIYIYIFVISPVVRWTPFETNRGKIKRRIPKHMGAHQPLRPRSEPSLATMGFSHDLTLRR